MLIDCPHCNARVNATEHGDKVVPRDEDDPYYITTRAVVCECPSCHHPLFGIETEVEWPEGRTTREVAQRVWPHPQRSVAWHVPDIVKNALEEADRCFQAGCFSASDVMCGRALEGMCVHFGTDESLAKGLQQLLDTKVIDDRLFEWGDELRKRRNNSAHATESKVSREDARDVLDFAHAITDYVFVLRRKFEQFMQRGEE